MLAIADPKKAEETRRLVSSLPSRHREKVRLVNPRSEIERLLTLTTYPYAIKNQRKARNAPSWGLWVP